MQLLGAATAAPRRSVARGGRAQLIEWSVRRIRRNGLCFHLPYGSTRHSTFRPGNRQWHSRVCRNESAAQALLDYLEGGETIEEFLDDFPSVSREQAIAFLEEAGRALLSRIA